MRTVPRQAQKLVPKRLMLEKVSLIFCDFIWDWLVYLVKLDGTTKRWYKKVSVEKYPVS